MSTYASDNATVLVREQLSALQACLDPQTIDRLETLGVDGGWRCLEVGGGGGSIATWLSERVGENGYVIGTDVEPSWMREVARDNLEVRQHDIVADELPAGEFDLVHARLVLVHFPERQRALRRMVRSLKPGGWLLLEEFETTWMPILAVPDGSGARLFEKVQTAMMSVLEEAGLDSQWAYETYGALRDQGLVDVGLATFAESWRGGSAGCDLHHVNSRQLQDKAVASQLATEAEFDAFRQLVSDPRFAVSSYQLVSTWGRRPRE